MPRPTPSLPPAAKLFFACFGLIFGGVGVTVLVAMWIQPFGEFGAPPLFFRIVASFIALGFIAFSGLWITQLFRGGLHESPELPNSHPHSPGSYVCPRCGAGLHDRSDVSPSGDAKCEYCGSWFNIHQQA